MAKSRTQLKKEATARQQLGARLVALSEDQLQRMDLPSMLMEAIRDIKSMRSRGARRRQMQFLGSLMRRVEVAPIQQALMEIEQGAYLQARAFQRIEAWRDRLVEGDDSAYADILRHHPGADRQRLTRLTRLARRSDAPPHAARQLFRYLRTLLDDSSGSATGDSGGMC